MTQAIEQRIRERAYEIWMASGMNEGEAEAHWLHAERAVRTETETATISTAAVAKGKAKPKAVARASKPAADVVAKVVKTKAVKTKAAAAKATATKTTAATRRPKAGPLEAGV